MKSKAFHKLVSLKTELDTVSHILVHTSLKYKTNILLYLDVYALKQVLYEYV